MVQYGTERPLRRYAGERIFGNFVRVLAALDRLFRVAAAGGSMPRFYFDTDDGTLCEDLEGLEFTSAEAARRAALAALPDMAKDRISDGDQRHFYVGVRDQQRRLIYRATLNLNGGWCGSER